MKYIIISFLLFSTLFAQEVKQKVTIGLGPFIQTQPYKDVDNISIISPVIFFDNDLFYIRWSRAGLYFLGDKTEDFSWGLSLTVQPRVYGYDSNDIQGMDERESTLEGGLAFSAKSDKAYIEIMALTDVLDKYDSWLLKTEMGYDLKYGKFSFYPSVMAIYQSDKFMNYYYGITSSEALKRGESEYIATAGLQFGVQTYIKYPFTKNISALINLRADKLPSSATSSSIVDDNYIYSGLASLIYTFEY